MVHSKRDPWQSRERFTAQLASDPVVGPDEWGLDTGLELRKFRSNRRIRPIRAGRLGEAKLDWDTAQKN